MGKKREKIKLTLKHWKQEKKTLRNKLEPSCTQSAKQNYASIEHGRKQILWRYYSRKGTKKTYKFACYHIQCMCKLFTQIITNKLEKELDENQPREQSGFRSKYSTTDHIHAINQLKEKCRNTTFHCELRSWIMRRRLTPYKPKQYWHHCKNKE